MERIWRHRLLGSFFCQSVSGCPSLHDMRSITALQIIISMSHLFSQTPFLASPLGSLLYFKQSLAFILLYSLFVLMGMIISIPQAECCRYLLFIDCLIMEIIAEWSQRNWCNDGHEVQLSDCNPWVSSV
jgi:hypothetical protein